MKMAHVLSDRTILKNRPGHDYGLITWEEYLEAYAEYAKRYGNEQSAERLEERGGFGYKELIQLLGHEPKTWRKV